MTNRKTIFKMYDSVKNNLGNEIPQILNEWSQTYMLGNPVAIGVTPVFRFAAIYQSGDDIILILGGPQGSSQPARIYDIAGTIEDIIRNGLKIK